MQRKDVLESAIKCVCRDRENEYGSPKENLESVARYLTEYTRSKYGVQIPYTGKDVTLIMMFVKIAREATGRGKLDNWVDMAGYAALGAELMEE